MEESEESPKKGRKKKRQSSGEEKVHKPNWREEYATPGDVKAFLNDHVYLRYNTVKHRLEARVPPQDPFCLDSELQQFVSDGFRPMSDRLKNTLLNALRAVKPTQKCVYEDVLDSGFVPAFNPFVDYLRSLPPWDGQDYILELSASVTVRGGPNRQLVFYQCLKRWLVAMVGSWVDDEVINHAVLVFIGRQGIYKTTWFNYLLPPVLRDYFRIKVNFDSLQRDDLIAMSQYGLVCYEELDVMNQKTTNTMKTVVTMPAIDERKPYGRYTEHMPHVASFCGTGNHVQFLNDSSGNRRWLPFVAERIDDPRRYPFNHAGIYAQAYALYLQGYSYYFSDEEVKALESHVKTFEVPVSEQESIQKHFRKPTKGETGELFSATDILEVIATSPALRVRSEQIGKAMTALGYIRHKSHGRAGYRVVMLKPDEIAANRRLLARDAQPDDGGQGEGGEGET